MLALLTLLALLLQAIIQRLKATQEIAGLVERLGLRVLTHRLAHRLRRLLDGVLQIVEVIRYGLLVAAREFRITGERTLGVANFCFHLVIPNAFSGFAKFVGGITLVAAHLPSRPAELLLQLIYLRLHRILLVADALDLLVARRAWLRQVLHLRLNALLLLHELFRTTLRVLDRLLRIAVRGVLQSTLRIL